MAKYRSHQRKIPKERRVAGWKAALNNPSTSSEGRSHARRQLLMVRRARAGSLTQRPQAG
ncbi:hypothetical protein FA10DRAFT_266626 [Acaromyces ingoldii]|uniref:Uncharacterized protein n=1 Tax=Acaromyces ingoldii TaxID=215250 RepID=A0A316YMT8_9BASI|nr:hypothetical protein FA10DRAFT_266626 [Acaromyces ingoldii]PWN90124.1 hypothetical protein FA10DRAFT_266626 [Acaromyces ingoldii]